MERWYGAHANDGSFTYTPAKRIQGYRHVHVSREQRNVDRPGQFVVHGPDEPEVEPITVTIDVQEQK